MIQNETAVDRFFASFQHASGADDIPSMVSHFSETFLAAGAQGTQCVRSAEFAMALPKRKELFARLGAKPATLVSLQHSPLDGRYALARATWRFEFQAAGDVEKNEVLVDSTYLIDIGTPEPKIVLYLSHQDIMQILRDRGILKN